MRFPYIAENRFVFGVFSAPCGSAVFDFHLRKAHEANDKAVMSAYGFSPKMTESEIVSELFKLYENLTKSQ